jgi:hypothetical protein
MALETASYVANLIESNPDGLDQRSTADNHLRLIKAALKRTFPQMDGPVSLSSAQVMYLGDLSASVQLQLNQLRDGSATANNALYANSASLALYANSASFASIAATANSASYAALAGQAASASFATLAATANSASYATLAGTAAVAIQATLALTANSASYAALAGTAANATNATDANSASSASTLRGVAPSAAADASTIVQRNASGDAFVRYINQSSTNSESISVGAVMVVQANDGYLRKVTPARLGLYTEARNITGRSGTAKTLASGSGPPSLSGSSNGDLFYYY